LTANTGPTGTTLNPGDYYFTITQPGATPQTNNAYRLVAVNQDGNTADTAITATIVNDTSNTVSAW
jgi:hypothetical protein